MVTLSFFCEFFARVAILTVLQTTIQELRAPSSSATLQGLTAYDGSQWQISGLSLYLPPDPYLSSPPPTALWFVETLSIPTVLVLPTTPILPAFTCPPTPTPTPTPTIAPLESTPPAHKKLHPLDAPVEYRPVVMVHHRVSNPLNPDDVFEFKTIQTVFDKYFEDLAWKPTEAPREVSLERSWVVVWAHMACILVFWILCGAERVHLFLVELVHEDELLSFIGSSMSASRSTEDEVLAFIHDMVLAFGLANVSTSVNEDTSVIGDISPAEDQELALSEEPLEESASIEELSDEEDMAAVEEFVQVVLDESMDVSVQEPESVEEAVSAETDSDEEDMEAVEDMIEVVSDQEFEAPVDVQASAPAEETLPAEEPVVVQEPVFVEEPAVTEESTLTEDAAQLEVTMAAEEPSKVSTIEEVVPAKYTLDGNAPIFVPRATHVRSSSNNDCPGLEIQGPPRIRRNSFTLKSSSTIEPPPTWNPVGQPISPELAEEPVFPTVSELPTVEKANEILDDLLSRLEREVREKETGVSGVIARFCGSSAPPAPPLALVEPITAPATAPVPTTTSTAPPPTLSATPEPRKIKTFTRSRPTRRR